MCARPPFLKDLRAAAYRGLTDLNMARWSYSTHAGRYVAVGRFMLVKADRCGSRWNGRDREPALPARDPSPNPRASWSGCGVSAIHRRPVSRRLARVCRSRSATADSSPVPRPARPSCPDPAIHRPKRCEPATVLGSDHERTPHAGKEKGAAPAAARLLAPEEETRVPASRAGPRRDERRRGYPCRRASTLSIRRPTWE